MPLVLLICLLPDFYPRSPCGERQLIACHNGRLLDFYPRSPCGERRRATRDQRLNWGISIHALLAESDDNGRIRDAENLTISIHALLAESDRPRQIVIVVIDNFYPRSPCGERLDVNNPVFAVTSISIHALLAESD